MTDELKDFIEKTNKIRGEFLGKFIVIENLLDLFLTRFFCGCKEKTPDFETFIHNVDSRNKIQFMKYLLKKYSTNKDEARAFIDRVIYYKDIRNNFAHSIIHKPEQDKMKKDLIIFKSFGNYDNNDSEQQKGQYSISGHYETMRKMDLIVEELKNILETFNLEP